MIRDVEERGRLSPGLTWLGAGALALTFHVGVFAAVFRQPEPATMATGGESTVEVDLEPVEGEKSPDDMLPPETSGDPTQAAAAAADSAATADAPATTTTLIMPRPPDLPLPPPLRPTPPTPSAQPPSQPPSPPEPATPAALPPLSDPELPKRIPEATPPATPEPPPPEAVPLQPPPSVSPPTEPASMSSEPPPPPPPPEPVPPPRPEPPKLEAVPPASEAPPARASAASAATAASEEAEPAVQKLSAGREAAWRGKLVGHLNRFRRVPPRLGSGTARVGFTIDAAGRVTEVRIVSGSGNAALDDAARALIVRASPFPRPPAGLSGKSLSFVVPVHFDVHPP